MQGNRPKHMFLYYVQPKRKMTTLVILAVAVVALYFYFGRMHFLLWILTGAIIIAFVQMLLEWFDRGPCIIINEEGINDKRLALGLIRWSDIERVRMQGLGGAYFISLELFDSESYLSRQPAYTRISNKVWRLYNISPIHIKVAYIDVAPYDLFEMIVSEVESNRSNRS